jgi:peroxiredoxin
MPLLHPGDIFPELAITVPGGKVVKVPGAFAGGFGVLLFYHGSWCSYCKAELHAFQRADGGIKVAALSVDDEATTAALIVKRGLTFPVGFGADARKVAELTGAFVNPDPVYLQSTWFVLNPQGKVAATLYDNVDHPPPPARRRGRAHPLRPRARPGVRRMHWTIRWG